MAYPHPAAPSMLQKLDQVAKYRLMLVITPPGSDIASLLIEWIRRSPIRATRLTLEETHNSPERFLADLQSALVSTGVLIGDSPTTSSTEDGMTVLVNATFGYTQDFVLVLENYHVIRQVEIHSAITLLLDYMPPQMHLVITSREQPPLPIPRLRVRSQVVELSI